MTDTAALRALADEAAAFRRLTPNWHRFRPEAGSVLVDPDTVRALCDAADEVERLRANCDELREQVQRLRASRESNRGGWERTLVERDALRAAVDRVRALGARAGRDRLAAWLASNGVEQPDTVAVEAAAFVLAALEPGNYGTPEWFSSIEKPLFPPSKPDDPHGACSRNLVAVARERDTARAAHAALVADLRARTEDEWGARSDDTERCALCRRKWSKHTDDDEVCFDASSPLAAYIADVRAVLDRHAPEEGA